jgi:hypothetical protein
MHPSFRQEVPPQMTKYHIFILDKTFYLCIIFLKNEIKVECIIETQCGELKSASSIELILVEILLKGIVSILIKDSFGRVYMLWIHRPHIAFSFN